MTKKTVDLDLFLEVLETYGSDQSKWPENLRSVLGDFAQTNQDAQKALEEAHAFDRLLSLAPTSIQTEDLKNKILSKTPLPRRSIEGRQDTGREEAADVVILARHPRTAGQALTAKTMWREAALLAASLILGFYLGISGLTSFAFNGDTGVASLDSEFEPLIPPVNLEEGVVQLEDLL